MAADRKVHKLSSGFTVTIFPPPRPGLRFVDATDHELAYHGLPPRPNRELAPYERPLKFIVPEFQELFKVHHPPPAIRNSNQSANWSGASRGPSVASCRNHCSNKN